MIRRLETHNIGPLQNMKLDFADRLNFITGDNGLGKSFILDLVWFSLTRQWPQLLNASLLSGDMARPSNVREAATIKAIFSGAAREAGPSAKFEPDADAWFFEPGKPASPGMVFYAMADGSFAAWDPMRNRQSSRAGAADVVPAFVFNSRQAMDGLPGQNGDWLCEGLIKDLTSWQNSKIYDENFEVFCEVLELLSSDNDKLTLDKPRTVRPSDIRRIPTLRMPYGTAVPIIHASAGVKRIVTLAYLLMWTWFGHKEAASARGKNAEACITFLFDEVESHLHPRWQRTIIPALMKVAERMSKDSGGQPRIQFIVASHSPLVMSSLEGSFDKSRDRWFDLDCLNGKVEIKAREYRARGDAGSWLTSEAFDL